MSALISILMVIVIGVGSVFGFYNGMVSSRENVDSQWSQVENQLQRRSDLVPNLVNTVKGYASHEKEVFQSVSDARAKMAGAQTVSDKLAANNELNGALSRLLAVAENYPQLKADQNFRQLQDELAAAKAARIHGYIMRLPNGYKTVISEDGGTGLFQGGGNGEGRSEGAVLNVRIAWC